MTMWSFHMTSSKYELDALGVRRDDADTYRPEALWYFGHIAKSVGGGGEPGSGASRKIVTTPPTVPQEVPPGPSPQLVPPADVPPDVHPYASLDVTSGPPGTAIEATGGGFLPDKPITVTESGPVGKRTVGTITSDGDGSFSMNIRVSDPTSPGRDTITFTQSGKSVSVHFTITSPRGGGGSASDSPCPMGWSDQAQMPRGIAAASYRRRSRQTKKAHHRPSRRNQTRTRRSLMKRSLPTGNTTMLPVLKTLTWRDASYFDLKK
jgi:hypothetical protein